MCLIKHICTFTLLFKGTLCKAYLSKQCPEGWDVLQLVSTNQQLALPAARNSAAVNYLYRSSWLGTESQRMAATHGVRLR
jgi:hypothetical protein